MNEGRWVDMVDLEIVCCMCGDVGFTDKLFRCNKCRHRFQHSYCSNFFYRDQLADQYCDWCQTEATAAKNTVSSSNSNKPAAVMTVTINNRSSNSGCSSSSTSSDKIIIKRKSPLPSPRHATRRYKLLKDVMC